MTIYNMYIWLHMKLFPAQHDTILNLEHQTEVLEKKNQLQRHSLQRYEDLLANKNAQAVTAQTLYVTEHAIQRYRERIGHKGTNDEIRKMIYKLTLRHLATLDKLEDGKYDLNDIAQARIRDNTVTTIIKRKK